MKIIETVAALREVVRTWKKSGATISFVPTMGNLHAGHLHLVEEAKKKASHAVTSVFVNPSQFGEGEDFAAYPRTPNEDADMLRAVGTDVLFRPIVEEIYPSGPGTFVEVPGLSEDLCGAFRPGHFRGVATVVCKLFNIVQPDAALFGEKDFQQLTIIRRMVADLDMPVEIIGVPTVREPSGLAMSSRNAYLNAQEKVMAPQIYQCLLSAKATLKEGRRDYLAIETAQANALADAGFRTEYFAIRRRDDLSAPDSDARDFVILAAAWLGRARLIDNMSVHT